MRYINNPLSVNSCSCHKNFSFTVSFERSEAIRAKIKTKIDSLKSILPGKSR